MSEPTLSRRVRQTRFPPNAAARNRAAELRAAGRDILDLTMGEPDFDTPAHIQDAAIAAMKSGDTRYPPARGTPALRTAIRHKLWRENALDCSESQIAVANGAKQIIYNAFAATLEDGDEVVIPAPFWPSFPDLVTLNGGRPVALRCNGAGHFKLTPEALENALTPRTRWLILNSPGNPSGAIYTREELTALAAVVRRHGALRVLCDEVYEHIRFTSGPAYNLLTVAPDLSDRALLVYSCSKTYAMPGWRIGFASGPATLISAMTVVQAQSTSGISSISQAAAVAALNDSFDFIAHAAETYGKRRQLVVDAFRNHSGLELLPPDGGFFAFPNCAALRGRRTPAGSDLESDQDVVDYLLEAAGVAVVAGTAFGLPWHLRLSFATASSVLSIGCKRITKACAALLNQ